MELGVAWPLCWKHIFKMLSLYCLLDEFLYVCILLGCDWVKRLGYLGENLILICETAL